MLHMELIKLHVSCILMKFNNFDCILQYLSYVGIFIILHFRGSFVCFTSHPVLIIPIKTTPVIDEVPHSGQDREGSL